MTVGLMNYTLVEKMMSNTTIQGIKRYGDNVVIYALYNCPFGCVGGCGVGATITEGWGGDTTK